MTVEDRFVMMTKEVASFSLFLTKYFVLIMKVKTHWKVKTHREDKEENQNHSLSHHQEENILCCYISFQSVLYAN